MTRIYVAPPDPVWETGPAASQAMVEWAEEQVRVMRELANTRVTVRGKAETLGVANRTCAKLHTMANDNGERMEETRRQLTAFHDSYTHYVGERKRIHQDMTAWANDPANQYGKPEHEIQAKVEEFEGRKRKAVEEFNRSVDEITNQITDTGTKLDNTWNTREDLTNVPVILPPPARPGPVPREPVIPPGAPGAPPRSERPRTPPPNPLTPAPGPGGDQDALARQQEQIRSILASGQPIGAQPGINGQQPPVVAAGGQPGQQGAVSPYGAAGQPGVSTPGGARQLSNQEFARLFGGRGNPLNQQPNKKKRDDDAAGFGVVPVTTGGAPPGGVTGTGNGYTPATQSPSIANAQIPGTTESSGGTNRGSSMMSPSSMGRTPMGGMPMGGMPFMPPMGGAPGAAGAGPNGGKPTVVTRDPDLMGDDLKTKAAPPVIRPRRPVDQ